MYAKVKRVVILKQMPDQKYFNRNKYYTTTGAALQVLEFKKSNWIWYSRHR